jgi:hypothetical protein
MAAMKKCDGPHDNIVEAYATVSINHWDDKYANSDYDYCRDCTDKAIDNWKTGGLVDRRKYTIQLIN